MQTPESNIVNEPFIEPPFPPQLPPEQNEVTRWRKKQSFYFHGKASEYFGIWIVNILLTIVTLGLYAPWAKVRRLRYFYGNTEFFKRRFDFTGIPRKILIGRLIALALYIAFTVVSNYSWKATLIGFLVIYFVMPWLIRATLRFKARNSKFGNSRFYFSGTNKEIYLVFFKAVLLTIFTLGLFYPVAVWLFKKYSLDNLYVGQLRFKLRAEWSAFMGAFYYPFLAFIALIGISGVVLWMFSGSLLNLGAQTIGYIFVGIYLTGLLFIWPLISARTFIATWNNTTVSRSEFQTTCNQWRYAWIIVSNWFMKIITIGFMTPWAAIRLYRYQVESLSLHLKNDPDSMINRIQEDHSAIAEEISDVFDFDVSL